MKRKSLGSSNLSSAGYDEATRTLEIEFASGGIYHYDDVPKDVYDGLLKASSPGSFFFKHVRQGFTGKKVGVVNG